MLHTEIVNEHSPRWRGFLYCVKSTFFILLFMTVLQVAEAMILFSGFDLNIPWQEGVLLFLATLLGVAMSAFLTDVSQLDSGKMLLAATGWFVALHMLLLGLLYLGGDAEHYGVSYREQSFEQLPISIVMVLTFFIISRMIFNRGAANM